MKALEHLLARQTSLYAEFAAMLRAGDYDDPIPHLEWNVGQLGKHILGGLRAYRAAALDDAEIWTDLESGDEQNLRLLSSIPEKTTAEIADAIPDALRNLQDAWRSRGTGPLTWSGGVKIDARTTAGLLLADLLVHGWDLSRALKRPWKIERSDAVDAMDAAFVLAPHFLTPAAATFTGTYEVRFRGDGRRVIAFDRGKLTVSEDTDAPVDCRLSADPVAFMLTSYGRLPVWRTAATGGILAFGKKPWLAFKFKSLLRNP